MIIARMPVRISLGGGGTDLPFFASRHGGFVLSVALDKYAYVIINRPTLDSRIRVKSHVSEETDSVNALKNDLVRAALIHAGIHDSIEVTFLSDVADGTGLGTSGAYAVGLMQTLYHYKNVTLDRHTLAEYAAALEMDILKRPVGKHDQYMAAFGGLRLLRIAPNGKVVVEDPPVDRTTLENLKHGIGLFYTGVRHDSAAILGKQKELSEHDPRVTAYYHTIKQIGEDVYSALVTGNLTAFGELLHAHWSAKRNLSGVSDPYFDKIYEGARAHGAIGGKLVGAGGGGFFMFYSSPQQKSILRDWLASTYKFREIPFSYDWEGAVLLH